MWAGEGQRIPLEGGTDPNDGKKVAKRVLGKGV
jgi:hypothetical protein